MPYSPVNNLEDALAVRLKQNGMFQELFNSIVGTITLTGPATLTVAEHANRPLDVNSPTSALLTLPATATSGVKFFGTNLGAGALSFAVTGGGTIQADAILPATVAQWSAYEIRRTAVGWVRVA